MVSKFSTYTFSILTLAFLLCISSCRTEEMEFQQEQPDDTLSPNSDVADLIQRTAMNDGSVDNILYNANCFTIQLPVEVMVNGITIIIDDLSDLDMVESIFDDNDDDVDTIDIQFPISIILNDFTVVNINSLSELYSYASNCYGENEWDDDIECLDFQYPISASIYNANSEIISTVTVNSDEQMYNFIDAIDQNDIITLNFPISILLSTGESLTINSLNELQNAIETYADDCDEDDDYDYNDDDCNNCTPLQLIDILTNCPDWTVDKLERNDNDYDDVYEGYLFNFFTDGSISVEWSATTVYGTWSANGSGNNITIDIDIPALPYCNLTWNLHEIEQNSGETKIDLREGDDDRMRYESNCN